MKKRIKKLELLKSIQLVLNSKITTQTINNYIDIIVDISNLLDKSLKNACSMIKNKFPQKKFCSSYFKKTINVIFGEITEQHGLSIPPIEWGFNPTEPQITGAISYFLSFCNYKKNGNQRAIAFLKALSIPIEDNTKIKVESEKLVYFQKRIDIYFEWGERPNKSIAIIEAKFGHIVTANQLSTYKAYAENNSDKQHLFLLTNKGKKNKRNKSWSSLSWLNLLKNWENELLKLDCNDKDFQKFKANLWKKIYGENQ